MEWNPCILVSLSLHPWLWISRFRINAVSDVCEIGMFAYWFYNLLMSWVKSETFWFAANHYDNAVWHLMLNHSSLDLHMLKSTHLKHLNHLNFVLWYLITVCAYRERHLIASLQIEYLLHRTASHDFSFISEKFHNCPNSVFTSFIDNRMMKLWTVTRTHGHAQ